MSETTPPNPPAEKPTVSLMPPRTRPGPTGGTLRSGNPGNMSKGATKIRAQFAEDAAGLRPTLLDMAAGYRKTGRGKKAKREPVSAREQLYAIEMVLRYGLDQRLQGVDVSEVRERMAATLDLIRELCPPDLAVALVDRMRGIWAGPAAA